jgi:flagellar basal-body rod modification protein FlgD
VQIQVLDRSGQTVDTIDGLQGTVGKHTVQWDGTDADGNRVSPGEYQFVVGARDAAGNVLKTTPKVMAEVQGVDYGSGGQTLLTSAGSVALEDITNVTQATSQ